MWIVIAVIAVISIIVIVSALSKKRKLDRAERIANSFELNEEPSGIAPLEEPIRHESEIETPRQESSSRRRPRRENRSPKPSQHNSSDAYASLLYYVSFEGSTFGPFTLDQLKTYPLLEDTLITTNTLNGTWYEAKYFECLDDLFRPNLPFIIDVDGTIIRLD